jgi:hypothetical protein
MQWSPRRCIHHINASVIRSAPHGVSPALNTERNSASTSDDPTTSNVAPPTSENPQSATSRPSEDAPPTPSHGAHHGTKPHVKGRNLIINTAMAIVSYAKSSQVNLLQGHMGYFLYVGRTPKRVIQEPLHRLGFSVKYDSISIAFAVMKSVAEDSALQLLTGKTTSLRLLRLSYITTSTTTPENRLHNQADMLNCIACYVHTIRKLASSVVYCGLTCTGR